MGIEEIEIDGQLITVSPPVSDISVNENSVRYQDSTGASETSFSTASQARDFADFLTNLA
ncbi:hypothetical protein [Lacimicrobium alkaliphilum]|uniref:Uncharacterized protein n=1 Tax=Lacimicrobium alkaliphilum TaxID=1526571 RepID=A0ABQ1RRW6_9ALTE|nr:hypothetical protein [Lacimicrobium alkaliphilum]GGD78290.1 hypothetical protein GCM10011357_36700 [Lacimicrobium alkaliphilum]